MQCKKIHNKLFDYLNGELSDKEKNQVENHLLECNHCKRLFERAEKGWKAIREERISYQPYFYTRLKQRIENRKIQTETPVEWVRAILQPAMYFVILGIGIFIGIQLGSGIDRQYTQSDMNQEQDYIEFITEYQYSDVYQIDTVEKRLLNTEKNETNE